MASVTMSFSVDAEDCQDIIAYYDKLPRGEKSREFVRVHKIHLDNAGITLADLSAKLDQVLEQLSRTRTSQELPEVPYQEGVDLSKLDNLGV